MKSVVRINLIQIDFHEEILNEFVAKRLPMEQENDVLVNMAILYNNPDGQKEIMLWSEP